MRQPDTYVDRNGNELPLAGLHPQERRLVKRLCRRAQSNPAWKDYYDFGADLFGKFAADRHMPYLNIFQTVAHKVHKDLTARLQIAQGVSPTSEVAKEIDDFDRDLSTACAELAAATGIPQRVLKEALAGGSNISIKEALRLLASIELLEMVRRRVQRKPRKKGEPRFVLYEIHYIGGPKDGDRSYAVQPDFQLNLPDAKLYEPAMDNDGRVIDWVDDETRVIRLYFKGDSPKRPHP